MLVDGDIRAMTGEHESADFVPADALKAALTVAFVEGGYLARAELG